MLHSGSGTYGAARPSTSQVYNILPRCQQPGACEEVLSGQLIGRPVTRISSPIPCLPLARPHPHLPSFGGGEAASGNSLLTGDIVSKYWDNPTLLRCDPFNPHLPRCQVFEVQARPWAGRSVDGSQLLAGAPRAINEAMARGGRLITQLITQAVQSVGDDAISMSLLPIIGSFGGTACCAALLCGLYGPGLAGGPDAMPLRR